MRYPDRRLRVGKKEIVLEDDVTVASLKSLDVNGITPSQLLPLIRVLKVGGFDLSVYMDE
jgi:hypothetical protein